MSLVSITYVFSTGATIIASQHNTNFSVIYNDYNGNITDANIAANAGIEYTKLALNNSLKYSDLSSATITSIQGNLGIPSGGIIMWSGAISAIPSGWFLCNGNNGTPNLSDRFVIAADADSGGTYNVGDTGDGTIPAHSHTFGTSRNSQAASDTYAIVPGSGNSTNSFGTGTKVIATYYALAYIMRS